MEIYQHERYMERERDEGDSREREIEYIRKERSLMRQSPLTSHHSANRLDSSNDDKGLMGSITHGTPRDYARNISPPISTSTTPLNLATSLPHVENNLPLKDEYSSRISRPSINAINGQENEKKPALHMENLETSVPVSSHSKNISFYYGKG
ncbi:DUF3736 domain-containing protein [Caerostris extrusa]|uniref:DUF3736 domain-containing protein n=1 Tax=Caerostris extrusa TaxID=172846 RepID=A0AAV4U273_CAEEX|nr:DUF3736 domain-containing protein [Caerostris extrusa]